MYILKIQGSAKIPDYLQIRDADFTLIAYLRKNQILKWFQQMNMIDREKEIKAILDDLPYGKITQLK